MRFANGDTITVHYPETVTDPFSGEQEGQITWPDLAGTSAVIDGVGIYPDEMIEDPATGRPRRIPGRIGIVCSYGVQVDPTCTIDVAAGPYAGTYEVDGHPDHWKHPATGFEAGAVVHAIRVEG